MTNINCSKNCKYQLDGKCGFHNFVPSFVSLQGECKFYTPASDIDELDANEEIKDCGIFW